VTIELRGAGQVVVVRCPKVFLLLLENTLTGWAIRELGREPSTDIAVDKSSGQYHITSMLERPVPPRADLIDCLNEFFLTLSYLTASRSKLQLLHCSAFVADEGRNIIVFGPKRAGKSTYVFGKACRGNLILADDLVFWSAAVGTFMCTGLPLRMRRPVPPFLKPEVLREKFLAGESLAYSRRGAFSIGPVGTSFSVDKAVYVEGDKLRPLDFGKYPSAFREFTINQKFLRLTKRSRLTT